PDEESTPQETPMMYTPSPGDDTPEEMVLETPVAQTVTPVTAVTPDVPQSTEPMDPATNGHSNGHSNGHTNGVHSHTDAGVNPLCPRCGESKCASFGIGRRVCMGCVYCERPLRPSQL